MSSQGRWEWLKLARYLGLLLCFSFILLSLESGQGWLSYGQPVSGKDVVPLNIVLEPSSPVRQGELVEVKVGVLNQGSQRVGFKEGERIPVEFRYRPILSTRMILFDTKYLEGLDIGDKTTASAKLDTLEPTHGAFPLAPGIYRIYVEIGEIPEEDSTNNETYTDLEIVKHPIKPDLVLKTLSFNLSGSIWLHPNPIIPAGQKRLVIGARVGNSGTDNATGVKVGFFKRLRGTSEVEQLDISKEDEIKRHDSKMKSCVDPKCDVSEWPPGVYAIIAQADPDGKIDELSEGNNLLAGTLFIVDMNRMNWRYPAFNIPLPEDEPEERIGPLEAGPVVITTGRDEQEKRTIYLGSDDGHLYTLKVYYVLEDGKQKEKAALLWSYPEDGAIGAVTTTPVVAQDEIYFGSDDGHLYVVDSSGNLSWQYPTDGAIGAVKAAPALLTDSEGTVRAIYFGSDDGNLYALNSDGTLRWQFASGAFIRTTPAVITLAEGDEQKTLICFGSGDGNLYALEEWEEGDQQFQVRLRWAFPTGRFVKSSPKIFNDTVYFGSSDGHLYALFLDGTKKWQYPLEGEQPIAAVESTPLVTQKKEDSKMVLYIYFGSNDGSIYKLKDEGNKGVDKWRLRKAVALGPIRSSPVKQGEMIYFGSDDGTLYAIDDSDGSDEWTFPTRGAITGSPAIEGDTLYLPSWEGHLYALNLEPID